MYKQNKLLVVVDVQNDFVTGSLGTMEAIAMIDSLVSYIDNWPGHIVFTRDTHNREYLKTLEGHYLPVEHCIRLTAGWEIVTDVYNVAKDKYDEIFDKHSFGSIDFQNYLMRNNYKEVQFCGLCTGICVLNNVMLAKAAIPDTPIKVLRDLCACVTPESHENALKAMELCQVEITNSSTEVFNDIQSFEERASSIKSLITVYDYKNKEEIKERYSSIRDLMANIDDNKRTYGSNINVVFMYTHKVDKKVFRTFDELLDYCDEQLNT